MRKPTIGLLPLYAGLYDRNNPQKKFEFTPFINEVADGISKNGVSVLKNPVCISETDVASAVAAFEMEADAIAVIFMAYHPSMDSAPPLARTELPLIMLDTTDIHSFGQDTDPAHIMTCHGIHGVQDLCCVLTRMGKAYGVAAGHFKKSDVLARTAGFAKAAYMAAAFKNSRVGLIGEPFEQMGDFAMPFDEMERLTGIKTVKFASINATDIDAERAQNAELFAIEPDADEGLQHNAAVTDAIIRKWVAEERLNAFSFNFLDFNKGTAAIGLPAVPFVTASKLMSEGIGYAGEGDVLTAALTGALLSVYPKSSFCEMFCPDWKGGKIFMSHMGEINVAVADKLTMVKKNVAYIPGFDGGVTPGVSAAFKKGEAVLVNLAPSAEGFTLILAPCEMEGSTDADLFGDSVRGWLKPLPPLEAFLEQYSMAGGTHHSCLCYGASVEVLSRFGSLGGWKVVELL